MVDYFSQLSFIFISGLPVEVVLSPGRAEGEGVGKRAQCQGEASSLADRYLGLLGSRYLKLNLVGAFMKVRQSAMVMKDVAEDKVLY